MALGRQIYDGNGKQTGTRTLADGKVEVSERLQGFAWQEQGTESSTIRSELRTDGSIMAELSGVFVTPDGQSTITFRGQGVGSRKPDGGITLRGAVYYWTTSPKFIVANTTVGVFEAEGDGQGNIQKKVWKWK